MSLSCENKIIIMDGLNKNLRLKQSFLKFPRNLKKFAKMRIRNSGSMYYYFIRWCRHVNRIAVKSARLLYSKHYIISVEDFNINSKHKEFLYLKKNKPFLVDFGAYVNRRKYYKGEFSIESCQKMRDGIPSTRLRRIFLRKLFLLLLIRVN